MLWVDDTAIVKKPLNGKTYYYVADCVTGKPVAKANVEFFGWKQLYRDKPPQYEVLTKDFNVQIERANKAIAEVNSLCAS